MDIEQFIKNELDKHDPKEWELEKILINENGLLRIKCRMLNYDYFLIMDFNKQIIEECPEFFARELLPWQFKLKVANSYPLDLEKLKDYL